MAREHAVVPSGLRQRTHEGIDRVMDKADSAQENVLAARENVDGYIRENPEKSVLIAAGVGAVVGGLAVAALMRKRASP